MMKKRLLISLFLLTVLGEGVALADSFNSITIQNHMGYTLVRGVAYDNKGGWCENCEIVPPGESIKINLYPDLNENLMHFGYYYSLLNDRKENKGLISLFAKNDESGLAMNVRVLPQNLSSCQPYFSNNATGDTVLYGDSDALILNGTCR